MTAVSASYIIPHVQIPPGGNDITEYAVSFWVGIDGTGDCSEEGGHGLLQTGTGFRIRGSEIICDRKNHWSLCHTLHHLYATH